MELTNKLKEVFYKHRYMALATKPYRNIQNFISKDFPYLIKDISSYKSYYIKHFESVIPDNSFYSNSTILKKLNIPLDNVICEHGLYFGDYFPDKLKNSWINEVVTFSEFRGEVIKANNKKPILIGPYIHYVDPIEDTYFKEDYFLIIISHATKGLALKENYDLNKYVISLEKAFGCKSLLLVHPNDINGLSDYSLNWTTSGFMEDKYYLCRLKRLMIDSKFVVTDFIGTHLGYAHYLKKQIFPIKKSFEVIGDKKIINKEFGTRVKSSLRIKQLSQLSNEIKEEEFIKSDVFEELVHDYWGFKYIIKDS